MRCRKGKMRFNENLTLNALAIVFMYRYQAEIESFFFEQFSVVRERTQTGRLTTHKGLS